MGIPVIQLLLLSKRISVFSAHKITLNALKVCWKQRIVPNLVLIVTVTRDYYPMAKLIVDV